MGQLSNNFQVVVGELNKTTGATATLSAGLDSFSNSMLSASNYTDEIVTGVELLALAYGSKLVGALTNSMTVRLQAVAADMRGVASANALSVANAETAQSELAKIQATKAELLLNQQVLVSQLRLAQSEQTRNAIRRQLAANSAALVATARLEQTALAGVATANQAVTATSYAATAATKALNGAMAMLGGPAGAIMLVAGAFVYFSSKSDEAAKSAEDFTDSISITKQALNELSTIQRQALEVKLQSNIIDLNKAYNSQAQEVASLQKELTNYSYWTDEQKQKSTSYVDLQNRIITATAELERRENEASKAKSMLYGVQQSLNGNMKDNYVAMQNVNTVTGIAAGIQNVFTGSLNAGNQALAKRNEYVTLLAAKAPISGSVAAEVAAINAETAALGISDARAREAALTRARYARDTNKTAEEVDLLTAAHMRQWDQEQKNNAVTTTATSTLKTHIDEIQRQKQAIADINQQLEIAKVEAASGGRAAVELTAKYEAQRQGMGKLSDSYVQAKLALYDFQQQQNTNTQFDQYLDNQTASLLKLKQQAQTQLAGPKQQIVVSGIDKKLQEQTFANLPTIDAGSQNNQQNQIAQLQTQTAAMNDAYNQRIELYKNYRALEVENAAYYDSQIQALEDKKAANNKAAQEAMMNLQLQAGESMATSAADSLRKMVGEQSAAYQTMFAVQKAFSIQRAILAIKTGIASAWEAGWPNGAIYAAGVVAATGSLVSDIMSVASPSFDGGGYTGNGSRSGGLDGKGGFWAMMHPQETVIDHTKSGGKGVSVGGSSNVTVNVSLQETSDTSKQGTTQQSTSDDGSVQISVFVSDIRSEGSMAQVLERTYGLTRMGA